MIDGFRWSLLGGQVPLAGQAAAMSAITMTLFLGCGTSAKWNVASFMLSDDRRSVPVPPRTGRGSWTRRLRRLTAVLLVLTVFGAWAWVEREPLLRSAGDLWIVSDSVTHADAVVVLGGGLGTRPFVAAEFYKKGLVNKVLISHVEEDPAAKKFASFDQLIVRLFRDTPNPIVKCS